jgi:hypothetical protein
MAAMSQNLSRSKQRPDRRTIHKRIKQAIKRLRKAERSAVVISVPEQRGTISLASRELNLLL